MFDTESVTPLCCDMAKSLSALLSPGAHLALDILKLEAIQTAIKSQCDSLFMHTFKGEGPMSI